MSYENIEARLDKLEHAEREIISILKDMVQEIKTLQEFARLFSEMSVQQANERMALMRQEAEAISESAERDKHLNWIARSESVLEKAEAAIAKFNLNPPSAPPPA